MTVSLRKGSTAELVFEAIRDLHDREQIVTRETLADVTELQLTTIDDRLGYLVDIGKIHRVQRGVFVPVEEHGPTRPISRTLLPDGTTVLEIGDETMHLSPREARMLGEVMAGSAQQFAAIQIGQEMIYNNRITGALVSDLSRDVRQLADQISGSSSAEPAPLSTADDAATDNA